MNNEKLVATYRDFLLQYFDAAFPLRHVWQAERKLDYMLLETWFTYPADHLLEHFDPVTLTENLEDTINIIYNAKRHKLLAHPFVQACIELNRAAFEELINE